MRLLLLFIECVPPVAEVASVLCRVDNTFDKQLKSNRDWVICGSVEETLDVLLGAEADLFCNTALPAQRGLPQRARSADKDLRGATEGTEASLAVRGGEHLSVIGGGISHTYMAGQRHASSPTQLRRAISQFVRKLLSMSQQLFVYCNTATSC